MRRLLVLSVAALISACPPPKPAPPPPPGPLQAGTATTLLDSPVGMPMGGYLRTRPGSDPGSPWAIQFPASQGMHVEPTARALALSNGISRVAFVRLDLTIVSPTLRTRVRAALAATGETANVVLYSTHTHAGPARFMPPAHLGDPNGTDFVALVMDHYDAEQDARLTTAIVDAITRAFASLQPVSVGIGSADGSDFNNDRRCENDPIYGHDFRDTAVTVIRFDVVDGSGAPIKPLTALVHYAMHGTVLGSDNTLQSTDGPGGMELYASDRLGIPVQYVQGAAGDVSPRGSPFGHRDLQNIERQGRVAALVVEQAWKAAAPGNAPAGVRLDFRERGVLVSREAIGYAPGEFPESGGLQCQAGGPGACGEVVSTPSQVLCLPLERKRPFHTSLSMVRLGDDLLFFTLPGEPGTGLTRKMEEALAGLGAKTTLPVGYSQDHFGYLLEADDWLRGGYEPTVSAFGWKFGPYLLSELSTFAATYDETQPAVDAAPLTDPTPRVPDDSMRAPQVVTEPVDQERLRTFVFQFEGGDPGLGLPRVSVEQKVNGAFVPLMASATRPVVNGPEVLLRYAATPTFKSDDQATVRTHQWTAKFEAVPDLPLGEYRFVARGTAQQGGAKSTYELTSRAFTVTASLAVAVTGRLSNDRLVLEARFPPNPSVYTGGIDDVTDHFRLWDSDASPTLGAHAHPAAGASHNFVVRAPSGTNLNVRFTWSDVELAWISDDTMTQTGAYTVTVPMSALTDASGNTNGTDATVVINK
ncbi:MAG: neutral/alkaline non-lysosomal ceramidase N-terminal domain-containing protein [Myxococcaceae bacterium]